MIKKKFKNILNEVINDKEELNKEKYVNIDSPLFEIVIKIKDFDKIYKIYISQKYIDEYNLKDDYIMLFKKIKIM